MNIKDKIFEQISNSPVVLYMKGSPNFPQCGFSSVAVEILKRCGVTNMITVDVLADPDIRQGIKEYSNWPTVPQLYINGEFVGGADIVREMYASGELAKMLSSEVTDDTPTSE
jgi:monothiol glutaredoxin